MTGSLRVLIADDERPARDKVRLFVEHDADIGVVYEASDGLRALEVVQTESPDIVFLDVQMPGLDGFQVVGSLPENAWPHIVFVTAYDEYALRAFEVNAVDYLLKPFDRERFDRALTRAKSAIASAERVDEVARMQSILASLGQQAVAPLERLLVEDGNRTILLKVQEVKYATAMRNYVALHTRDRTYRIRTTLTHLEERLDPVRFIRINRSEIINADHVGELVPAGHGDYDLKLDDGNVLRLSRRYRGRLDGLLGR